MYDVEHKELFDAIRGGRTVHNGDYMFTSTMLGILAEMVCYTGQEITWEKAMSSDVEFLATALRLGRRTARQTRRERPLCPRPCPG